MEILCTRPHCSRPNNFFSELSDPNQLKTTTQKFCTSCGMPLILADRYIPEKLLGQGGFGAAFKARDRYSPTSRYCVVKQFKPTGNFSPQELQLAQELFAREAKVLEELGQQHPQIPDLYAFFTPIVKDAQGNQEQYFYLVQEYIDGTDLATELQQTGQFSEAAIKKILAEVLGILDFIHQRQIIHRDIKPSNIMRDRNNKIYLLDFGAVKQITHGSNNGKSTGIYSLGFAPPEQMAGKQVYPATDLYALAVTCISLLTGKPAEQLYDHFNSRWTWHDQVNVSDRLTQTLDRMLQSSPAKRIQSAKEVLKALTQTVNSNPPAPNPSSRSTPSMTPATPISQNISPNVSQTAPSQPQKIPPVVSATAPIAATSPATPIVSARRPQFALWEVLSGAAFIGFEGSLLAIALTNLFAVSGVSIGILGGLLAGLLYAQTRRIIEGIDFAIIAAISTALIFFIPLLQGEMLFGTIIAIAAFSGVGAVAITALFRLVYSILVRLLN